MKTSIISVGTELLFGQIVNTNTAFLSQQLNLLGFDVMYHYTAGDNPVRLEKTVERALEDCDLIITTGGLGPTEDDLTKETVCKAFGEKLVVHEPSMKALEEIARRRNRPMTENNFKQAMMPEKGIVFKNDVGSAPGFAVEKDGKMIISMPGPPFEMKYMWNHEVKPFLEKKQDSVIYYETLRLFGIGESSLETALMEIIHGQTDPTIATYAKEGECSLRIASKRGSAEEAKAAVASVVEEIKARVGQYIYCYEDMGLAEVVGRKLIDKRITISSCESCTGGMFASQLAGVSGISAVFDRSLVTYTYDAKISELGVKRETLSEYTAESPQVAEEMVTGLKEKTGSDICISVTGLAGPGGGTEDKPVGTIYIGCSYKDQISVKKIQTNRNDRNWNRNYACLVMFDMINKIIDINW